MSTNSGTGSSEPDRYYNRRLRGTVVYKFRNHFSFGVLGVSFLCGLMFHYLPPIQKLSQSLDEGLLADNEEIISRKGLFKEQLRISADTLRKALEDEMKPVP